MKIDSEFIKKIFSLKIKLKKKEDKIKLSKYEDEIPMYDIYSKTIYPIKKTDLYSKLINNHYRFINFEIYDWISDLYKRYNKDIRFQRNVEIMNNYEIDTLIDTSYKTFYKYSPELGLSISICKRSSFSPYLHHLKPYYTKLELIKLSQNMGLNEHTDLMIELEKLIDTSKHNEKGYKDFCLKVSNNDVVFLVIKQFHQYIYDSNIISWICFYSFTGSFLFNKYLRNINVVSIRSNLKKNLENEIPSDLYDGLHKIVECMKNAPALDKNYKMYRFIWDDSFFTSLKIGDIFLDKGFVSTTRDPFYSPGLNGNFGLILIKIKLPKDKKGLGLFIENYSLFPNEEEFILAPYSRIKLLSKNENFKYYHTNENFEKLIDRKYEFELVDIDYKLFYKENPKIRIKEDILENIDIRSINIEGYDRIDIINKFIALYSHNNKVKLSGYTFTYNWFDSSNRSAYEKFYYNKTTDGIIFTLMDEDGYPYLNIELGETLAINYLNKYYYGKICINKNDSCYKIQEKEFLDLIYHFGRIFYYKKALIFHTFCSFEEFKDNYEESYKIYTTVNLFNKTIYNYLKYGKKQFENNSFISYDVGYWYLDEYFNKKSEDENFKTNKELLINVIEKKSENYYKLFKSMDKNIFKKCYFTFNIYDKLLSEGLGSNFKPDIGYSKEYGDENFRLIFRQPIKRV